MLSNVGRRICFSSFCFRCCSCCCSYCFRLSLFLENAIHMMSTAFIFIIIIIIIIIIIRVRFFPLPVSSILFFFPPLFFHIVPSYYVVFIILLSGEYLAFWLLNCTSTSVPKRFRSLSTTHKNLCTVLLCHTKFFSLNTLSLIRLVNYRFILSE
jgi:hypothetical protein